MFKGVFKEGKNKKGLCLRRTFYTFLVSLYLFLNDSYKIAMFKILLIFTQSFIFNKNTLNLSYSCLPNIGNIINSHNRKILQKPTTDTVKPCNCRKFECPVKDQKMTCRTESVIYEATVKAENKSEEKTYIGLTGMEFKQRHYQHRHDFQNINKRESTELSKHIWNLKDNNIDYSIRWKIIKQIPKIQNGNKMCRLCITEASIIMKNKIGRLNKRTEIMNKCRHQNKFLLKNWKSDKEKTIINTKKTRK